MPNIPSNSWFPRSLQERAAWFANFAAQFAVVAASLGFLPADVAAVQDDNTCFQGIASGRVALDAFDDAVRDYAEVVTEGDIGDPTPAFPAATDITPAELPATGIFRRLIDLRTRIMAAPAFTDEIGSLLGINPKSAGAKIPTIDNPPVLKASVAPGNIVEVKFTKGTSDGIYIEKNVDGAGWEFADKGIKSPAVFAVAANPANTPRGVQLRARYLEGNNPVGDWSDIIVVQTIP